RELPFEELPHAILRQAQHVEDDGNGERHGEVLYELAMPLILERGDQLARASAHLAVQFGHFSRRERWIQRHAEGGMARRIELGGNHIPALADHRCKLAIALLDEIRGVVVDRLQILVAANHPAAAARSGEDIGAVENRRPLVDLRNDVGKRIHISALAWRQRKRISQLRRNVGWQGRNMRAHGGFLYLFTWMLRQPQEAQFQPNWTL